MKPLACLLLLFSACSVCLAQSATPAPVATVAVVPTVILVKPLPDSVRQAVQQLFKRGRRLNVLVGVSGLAVLSSGIKSTVNEGAGFWPLTDIVLGSGAATGGLVGQARYSRRQERQALAALEVGKRLPPYVSELAPLLPRRNRQIILGKL